MRFLASFAFAGVAFASPALRAADLHLTPVADQMGSPISTSFEKSADADSGPYVLKIKNTSGEKIKVTVKVSTSVPVHNQPKDRTLAQHTIKPGDTWTVEKLASSDKVNVSVVGFSPIDLVVP